MPVLDRVAELLSRCQAFCAGLTQSRRKRVAPLALAWLSIAQGLLSLWHGVRVFIYRAPVQNLMGPPVLLCCSGERVLGIEFWVYQGVLDSLFAVGFVGMLMVHPVDEPVTILSFLIERGSSRRKMSIRSCKRRSVSSSASERTRDRSIPFSIVTSLSAAPDPRMPEL